MLDKDVNSDLHVFVGDSLKFGAQVGVVGDNLAVQVVSLIEREGNNDR
jgi:flagellar motor switch protein FliM